MHVEALGPTGTGADEESVLADEPNQTVLIYEPREHSYMFKDECSWACLFIAISYSVGVRRSFIFNCFKLIDLCDIYLFVDKNGFAHIVPRRV